MLIAFRVGIVSLALAAMAVTSPCAHAQLKEPTSQSDRELVASVSKRLASCFTSLGVKGAFALTPTLPAESELAAVTLLPATGPVVNDGYAYWLALHASRKQVYVRQVGGFAGAQKLYGPIAIDAQCG
ncbi:hypothetical protein PFX98_07120 [Paucibacter sediminis]|uniref:Uncharacterized protein n=1 Tax=Paucibacter sediminis TaxID=3019553 RepID=A0AA95NFL7_9BURK|nr:hypothetical protein [Paucibacter sp. S2-9]WIT13375.1 hypothetical protein PFX98_07120 [Paucibacter sp. S2-9]